PKHAAPEPAQAAPAQPGPAHAAPAHAAPAPAQAAPAAGRTYQVRPGDTLSGIATQQKVNGGWQAIYESNRGDLRSANLIHPGQQLHLG
ncbi:MAG TPA: LysM domain-containing protein, partial [Pseudonocardia sp.]|nr:LysM domain-containing protein [Pseudonocardia sp.]